MGFSRLVQQPVDPLLSITGLFAADDRAGRMDLGVGVYRDDRGRTPVFAAVKAAERRLWEEQASKAYLGSDGDPHFVELLGREVFAGAAASSAGLPGIQTPGGTGALSVAAQLLALAGGGRRVWLGLPSWPNHHPILASTGLDVATYDHYDIATRTFRLDRLMTAIAQARPGDAFVLHGCCHNPTGADPTPGDWQAIASALADGGLIPVIDMAYQGLGDGWHEDGEGTRAILAAVPSALVAYSCDKNFGLYRDRVGALFLHARDAGEARLMWANAVAVARRSWSMPPDHGAAVVRLILGDDALARSWRDELDAMRGRIVRVRAALADAGMAGAVDLTGLRGERGMFAMLPVTPGEVERLRTEAAIYMAGSGRINLAGLAVDGVPGFVAALAEVTAVPA